MATSDRHPHLFPVAWLVSVLFAGTMGFIAGSARRPATASHRVEPYDSLSEFAEVLYYVNKDFVEPVSQRRLIYQAISGLLQFLGPHNRFFPREMYDQIRNLTTGVYGGVGVTLTRSANGVVISHVTSNGPAQQAGLRRGDLITQIDRVRPATTKQAERRLQGKVGNPVVIQFKRGRHVTSVTVKRTIEHRRTVSWSTIVPKYGYLRISTFTPGCAIQVRKGVEALGRPAPLKGLIVDLRGNPGGMLSEGLAVADLFVASGTLLIRRSRRRIETLKAHRRGTLAHCPMVVLIDRKTASSAELVAAALRDNRRATLVGTKTYGKGTFQELLRLKSGAILKLTVGRYDVPSGKNIDRIGVLPDLFVNTRGIQPPTIKLPSRFRNDRWIAFALASLQGRLTATKPTTQQER